MHEQRPMRCTLRMPPKQQPSINPDEGCSSQTESDDEVKKAVELQQQQQPAGLRWPGPPPPPAPGVPEAPQPPVAAPAPPVKQAGKAGKTGKGRRPAGAITIKTLVDAGLLIPGIKTLTVDYKSNCYYADLSSEGQIHCNGLVFDSPSAFSIYIKRLVNPTRKADDGWKSVKYAGKLLETYKDDYLRMQQPVQPGQVAAEAADRQPQPSGRGGRSGSAGRAGSNGVTSTGLPAAKRHRVSEPPPVVGTTSSQQMALQQHTTSGPSRHLHLHQQQPVLEAPAGPPQPPPAPAGLPVQGPNTVPPQPPLQEGILVPAGSGAATTDTAAPQASGSGSDAVTPQQLGQAVTAQAFG